MLGRQRIYDDARLGGQSRRVRPILLSGHRCGQVDLVVVGSGFEVAHLEGDSDPLKEVLGHRLFHTFLLIWSLLNLRFLLS